MRMMISRLLTTLSVFGFVMMGTASTAAVVNNPLPVHIHNDINELLRERRNDLVSFAKEYLGSRYRYNGTTHKGFDCSGFTSFVFDKHGIILDHSSRGQSKFGKRVAIKKAQPGDLLFFGVRGNIHHVGIVVSNTDNELMMIHSSTSRGVVIENVWTSAYWRKRLMFVRDVLSTGLSPEDLVQELDTF